MFLKRNFGFIALFLFFLFFLQIDAQAQNQTFTVFTFADGSPEWDATLDPNGDNGIV